MKIISARDLVSALSLCAGFIRLCMEHVTDICRKIANFSLTYYLLNYSMEQSFS
jgi:hypothetical protein